MATPGNPDGLDYQRRGEPFADLVGRSPTTGLDYSHRGEPYAAAAPVIITSTLAGTIGPLVGSLTVSETIGATLAGTTAGLSGSAAAVETITSTLSGAEASPTASITVAETLPSTLSGALPAPTASFDVDQVVGTGSGHGWRHPQRPGVQPPSRGRRRPPLVIACTLHGVLPALQAELQATNAIVGRLEGTLAPVSARIVMPPQHIDSVLFGELGRAPTPAEIENAGLELFLLLSD